MRRYGPRHALPRRKIAFILLTLVGLGLIGTGAVKLSSTLLTYKAARTAAAAAGTTSQPPSGDQTTSATDTTAATGPTTAAPAVTVHPIRIEIAQIHVNAPVQELGLTTTGTLAVPTQTNQAGWYTGSAVPGQLGPSVIAGHLDTTSGPAVFYDLRELKTGDEITILLSSGTTVGYHVTSMATDPKLQFPTAQVYGPSPDGELRLITCSGSLVDGSYLDNLIVYARLDNAA